MRSSLGACLALVLAAVLAASPAQAFPIGEQDYAATTPFSSGLQNVAEATVLSGRMVANSGLSQGPYIALNVTGFAMTGLTKACWWTSDLPECMEGANLRLEVADGGAVGLQFPRTVRSNVTSQHSLAFFVDVNTDLDYPGISVTLDRDIAGVHVGGELAFGRLPSMPTTASHEMAANNAAGLMLMDGATRLAVKDGANVRNLSGHLLGVTFQGAPVIAPFGAGATLTPFPAGASAHFEPADDDAARQGINPQRVMQLGRDLQEATGSEESGADTQDEDPLADLQALLGSVLDGALLTLPGSLLEDSGATTPGGERQQPSIAQIASNVTLLRFDSLDAASTENGTVALSGSGPLQIQGGRVVGAPNLMGPLPWWCWLLWVAALGMWIARLVMKPAKENEQWDKLRWVGWVAGPVVAFIVFWLWDGQVHKVWGLSLMGGNPGGTSIMFLLLVEVVLGLVIYVAAVLPMQSLLKSGARFAGQGRFMGLHRPVAMVLGFLLGTTLMLAYMDLVIQVFA